MRYLLSIFILSIILGIQLPDKLKEIVQQTDNLEQPEYFSATMTLLYKDNNGKILEKRKLKYWRIWRSFNKESVLIKFISPEEVKNTSFLSITEDDKIRQLIFLPGLEKIRSIKQANLNSSFMNSDFNYSDLISWKLANNTNKLINESKNHYLIESIFKNIFINQRLVLKINKRSHFIEEVEFFEKDCQLPIRKMKNLQINEESGIYFSSFFTMTKYYDCSEKIRSSTEIIFNEWDIITEIDDSIFTESNMTKIEF